MKRRDFLKVAPAAMASALPLAMTEPAFGIGDWDEYFVGDWMEDGFAIEASREIAMSAFADRMRGGQFTEIKGFREKVTWNEDRRQRLYVATACLR